jgi:hypothetical protein
LSKCASGTSKLVSHEFYIKGTGSRCFEELYFPVSMTKIENNNLLAAENLILESLNAKVHVKSIFKLLLCKGEILQCICLL